MIPTFNSKKPYIVANDETCPFQYDYLVTVVDSAKITKEGDAVVGGNKVKIGLPITLEGAKYKLNGVITNITVSPLPNNSKHCEDLDKHTKLNQDVHHVPSLIGEKNQMLKNFLKNQLVIKYLK